MALQRLAWHEVETARFISIAISGVWNWRGTVGKTGGPRGERVDVRGPINDLNRIIVSERTVFILFDANVATNDSVKWARIGIARELATRHATVKFINLPGDCGVNGVDDLLAAWGPARVLELFDRPAGGASLQVALPPQFQQRAEGMYRVTTRGQQLVETQLTNYRASIVTNICLDDGVETKREFELQCELTGRPFGFTIPSSRFSPMDWPIEQMGPYAITFPNQKEYARAAIQSHSVAAEERRVYTHSGWRSVDGQWSFLHAGGAIAAAGAVPGLNVRLPGALSRYELKLPSTPEALAVAVRSSLMLIELLPASIGFPVFAAIGRAVLGDADFALHLAGETEHSKAKWPRWPNSSSAQAWTACTFRVHGRQPATRSRCWPFTRRMRSLSLTILPLREMRPMLPATMRRPTGYSAQRGIRQVGGASIRPHGYVNRTAPRTRPVHRRRHPSGPFDSGAAVDSRAFRRSDLRCEAQRMPDGGARW